MMFNKYLLTLLLTILFINIHGDCPKQTFFCGSRQYDLNCESQNGICYLKSGEYEDALRKCNNTFNSQLLVDSDSTCKLSRESDEEFVGSANECSKKQQSFHCVKKNGQIAKIDVPCESKDGKCYTKKLDYKNAKSDCTNLYNGELKYTVLECKLPE